MYNISSYSFSKANSLNVDIKPSTKKNKKIDVYKNNKYICSIGDSRYSDYPTYLTTHNKEYADKRNALYHLRHQNEKDKLNTAGYYAYHILW